MVNITFSLFTNIINEIWIWLLNNLFLPFIVITFLLLFFFGQYWLVKLYIYLGKYFVNGIVSLTKKFANTKIMRELVEELDIDIFSSNEDKGVGTYDYKDEKHYVNVRNYQEKEKGK